MATAVPTSSKAATSSFFGNNHSLEAEIRWALKAVESNFSYNSSTGLPELFKTMFPDSAIAQNFTLSERKSSYLVQFGLAPYFSRALVDQVRKNSATGTV